MGPCRRYPGYRQRCGQGDRYDEPCAVLSQATGIQEQPRPRLLVADAKKLDGVGKGTGSSACPGGWRAERRDRTSHSRNREFRRRDAGRD